MARYEPLILRKILAISPLALTLVISLAVMGHISPAASQDYRTSIQARTTHQTSAEDQEQLRQINLQIKESMDAILKIVEKNPAFPKRAENRTITKFTYSVDSDTAASVREIIIIDGDLVLVGCEQDPPGVSCMGPCPCEGTPQPQ